MAEEQAPEAQATPVKDAFISYASHDKAVADSVCKALENAGIVCWIAPRDVVPGESFAGSIVHAIDATKVIVLVLSEHAATSQHVLREVERASSKRHPLIAFRIDLAPMPADFEYFLNTSQWLDASTVGVKRALPKLVEATRSALSVSSSAAHNMASPAAAASVTRRPIRMLTALVAITVAVLGSFMVDRVWLSNHGQGQKKNLALTDAGTSANTPAAVGIPERSIAVLPFVDMSEKHDQEYFADGLSEELIDHLAHIPELKVIARTSSFAFKGKSEDTRSIAAKLGVANLLEGSVRKAGGRLRITAQLIRAADGVHLWSEIYDRKLTDIFEVQDEISTTVAKALNIALSKTPTGGAQAASHGTTNVEAYNLLLQGNYFFLRGNTGDVAKAAGSLEKALSLDSRYSTAWARLARVYAYQAYTGELTAAESESRSRDAVRRALAIDPNCAEAYYARGNILRIVVGDWAAAKLDYERAVALDPHGQAAERAQELILYTKASVDGRYGELIEMMRRELERSPLDVSGMYDQALYQYFGGQLAESAATSRRLLELNPTYETGQSQYALTLLLMGKKSEALAAAQKESDDASKLMVLACVYWAMGRRTESDSALGALEQGFADRNAYEIAQVHAYRREADAAFAWLGRAERYLRVTLFDMKFDPMLGNLHGDPRFAVLLRKVKLLE